jgi:uncharacterized membrane protein
MSRFIESIKIENQKLFLLDLHQKRVNDTLSNFGVQGLSSSIVYFVVVALQEKTPWYLLMVFIFILNVILAVILAKFLKKMDAIGWNILNKLRDLTTRKTP